MADNYVQYSDTVDNLTDDELKWWEQEAENLVKIDENEYEDVNYEDNEHDYKDENSVPLYDVVKENDESYIWFKSDEGGNIELIAKVVQKFLKKYRPTGYFSLTWSDSCSKLRVGEFGGGSVFVTADDIKWMDTYSFIDDCREQWESNQNKI